MTLRITLGMALFMLALAGCSTDTTGVPLSDAGLSDMASATDAPMRDTGVVDLGASDARSDSEVLTDAGSVDGDVDAAMTDLGALDAGDTDAGEVDAGSVDVDAGEADAGDVDAGSVDIDAGAPDAGEAIDFGTDAGDVDLGSDAGPPPAIEIISCTGATPGITVANNMSTSWSPSSAFIGSGEIVRWNVSMSMQTVTSGTVMSGSPIPDGRFDVSLAPGESLCIRFNEAGSYPFYSAVHTNMTGTITVIGS
ncbi:MAG: hypothetical protein IPK60_24055 [Sandaracinaceae bacterium]|nr:hypothetical protein [Sandaracinaceae bacterium]